MGANTHTDGMSRRAFLRMGAAGTAFAAGFAHAEAPAETAAVAPARRKLGRTDMHVGVVSMGALVTTEAAVFQAAFDLGVNFVDTARNYMDGRNERVVGEALKGYRDKVYVATKIGGGSRDAMMRSIGESLEALKVDRVDLLQVHGADAKEQIMNAECRAVMKEARAQGKTRYIGVSTHSNEVEIIDAIVNDPERLYDTVLTVYNFKSGPEVKEAIARAAAAGVGVIAMKTQAGGYTVEDMGGLSPHQAALKWVLQDPNVATTVPSMANLDQVREDVAVMRSLQLTRNESALLERYGTALAGRWCHRCGACQPTCPRAVDIPGVNRALMYAEGYGAAALARSTYRAVAAQRDGTGCGACSHCVARCPHGLDLADRMPRAREWFS